MAAARVCANQVKQQDRERWLQSMMLPKEHRLGFLALRALHLELAHVRDQVTQSSMAQIRLAWWRDSISNLFDQKDKLVSPDHPVLRALLPVICQTRPSKTWFLRVVNAREDELFIDSFQNIAEMEALFERMLSPVLYVSLELVGIRKASADHAASHLGKAAGLVNCIRRIPYSLGKEAAILLPRDLLDKNPVDWLALRESKRSDALEALVFAIACQAKAHIEHARKIPDVPILANPVLLEAVILDHYLSCLEKENFNVFAPKLQSRSLSSLHIKFLYHWIKSDF